MAVDDVGRPAKLLDCFQRTLAEEDHAFTIIIEELLFVVAEYLLSFEVVVIVHEVDLKTCIWQRGDLYDQRIVVFINNNINTG